MLHDRQGSIGLFGPFDFLAYTIAGADVAAYAANAASSRVAR